MQLTGPNHLQCCGRVKYSGLDTGNVTWKNGVLILENLNGIWKMTLEYDVCRGKPQKSVVVRNSSLFSDFYLWESMRKNGTINYTAGITCKWYPVEEHIHIKIKQHTYKFTALFF